MEPNSLFYKKPVVLKITQTGLLLTLAILLNFIGSKFLPFGYFLKFDFSLIAILIAFHYVGFFYGLSIIILLFIIGPAYSTLGYDSAGILGNGILAIMQIIFSLTFFISFKFFKYRKMKQNINIENLDDKNKSIIKWELITLLICLIISSTITITIMLVLNTFITTPLYFYLFKITKSPFLTSFLLEYHKVKYMFFNSNNYFLGSFLLYFVFNLINLTVNAILIYTFMSINTKTNFLKIKNY